MCFWIFISFKILTFFGNFFPSWSQCLQTISFRTNSSPIYLAVSSEVKCPLPISLIFYVSKVVITWSWLARMKFCPALPGSRQCYKLFINYVLRLHVKRFISARLDPSFVHPGSRFAGTKFSHVIASARLGGIKKLIKKYP